MNPYLHHARAVTRREFLSRSGKLGLGAVALQSMLSRGFSSETEPANPMSPKAPPLPGRVKSVIYLGMSGAPPQHDLFDWKPELVKHHLQECPEEFLKGQTFAFIKGRPKLCGTPYKFQQYGQSGAWVSEMLPHFTKIVDDLREVREHLAHPGAALAVLLELIGCAAELRPAFDEGKGLPFEKLLRALLQVVFDQLRLPIEEIVLGRRATHAEVNDGLHAPGQWRRLGRHRVGRFRLRGETAREHALERNSAEAKLPTAAQEFAAGDRASVVKIRIHWRRD